VTATIAAQRMRELVEQGHAWPLLAGYFPVPVELDGRWWHVPTQPTPAVDLDSFVPAPAAVADELARLAARRRAADDAMRRGDWMDPP
jgi:hypothetical protein